MTTVQADRKQLAARFSDAVALVSAVCFPGHDRARDHRSDRRAGHLRGPMARLRHGAADPVPHRSAARGDQAHEHPRPRDGKPHWGLWLNLAGLVFYLPAFVVGVQFGINGVAWAFMVGTTAMVPVELGIMSRTLAQPWWHVLVELRHIVVATAVMCVPVFAATHCLPDAVPGEGALALGVAGGALAYLAVVWVRQPALVRDALRLGRQVGGS